MNKDVIKKYKDAFDHWLADGKILVKYKDDSEPEWLSPDEEELSTLFNGELDSCIYIIDDEYAEFRKAQADGKIIQYYVDGFVGWQDVTEFGIHPMKGIKEYRIKPDEHELKVGNWVKDSHDVYCKILEVDELSIHFRNSHNHPGSMTHTYMIENNIEPWKPKPDEWCWFYMKSSTRAILAKYDCTFNDKQVRDHTGEIYNHCEPFIGTLPSQLKETT